MAAMLRIALKISVFLCFSAKALAIDVLWTDSKTGQILRATAAGGAAQVLFDASDYPSSPSSVAPFGIAADDNFVYWSDFITGEILRGSLDGQGSAMLVFDHDDYPASSIAAVPSGLSVDDSFVYWGDTDNTAYAGRVLSGSIFGVGSPQILYEKVDYPSPVPSAAPTGVAAHEGIVYWIDSLTKQVLTASTSGSGAISVLFDIGDYPGSPSYISPTFLTVIGTGYDADFDGSGAIDGSDFLRWQRGQSPAPLSAEDLALWRAQFGSTPLVASIQVLPEPIAIRLSLYAGLMASLMSSKRLSWFSVNWNSRLH